MPVDWERVRSEFPALEGWTFLNTATFGQLPRRTTAAIARHFAHRDETACSDFLSWFDDADGIRGLIGQLINCTADDVAFIPNAAYALATFLNGIDWRRGARIVTFENEFPNNQYHPALLARNRGVEFVETSWDRFYDNIPPRTRAVLVSTCNYTNGFRPPLKEMSTFLRERGVLLFVDATQSLGALQFDVEDVQPDVLACHGYKWLLCPNGAGFMYVRPDLRRHMPPLVVGWRSDQNWRQVDHLHHGAPEFKDSAEKYEGAMLDFPAVYAMGASVEFFLELGPAEIEERVLSLAGKVAEALERRGGQIQHRNSPIVAAKFENIQTSDLAVRLKEKRILVSSRHENLRVSVHLYNNEQDIAAFDQALEGEL
jgi:selenocysteine lyase/cysteine desulfurase